MCGIIGTCNVNKKPIDSFLLQAMTNSLKHRGPDDAGVYIYENVGLGHTRLSILDLSKAGHQPMLDESEDVCIVFNGEIYNFKELRSDLENLGHIFKSKTDTEVILKSYKAWGVDCLQRFNGMFALAIFDKKNEQIFLARDRMGEKPLYYYLDQEKFIFASEIKAIIEDKGIRREIDPQGMVNYFTFGHSIAPDTMYKGIKKLLPGHYLVFQNGQVQIKAYWAVPLIPEKEGKGKEYYQEKIKTLFEDSVKERLVSDVPLGVFLSGGLDSSAVVAIMAKQGVSPLKTFSVGFDIPGREFNELADAKIVADYFKTEHHEILLKETDLIDTLHKLVWHFDEPFGDAANFPVFYMSQFAKQHVSVVLTGEGGDELFGGYRRYAIEKHRSMLLFLNLLFSNTLFNKIMGFLPNYRRTKKLIGALPIKDDLLRYTGWLHFFSEEMRNKLFKNGGLYGKEDPLKMYKKYFLENQPPSQFSLGQEHLVEKYMYLDQKILLPDGYLEKVDKASMAVGLETRAPLLDHHLVELANDIPLKYKIHGFNGKVIFKEAMERFLPKHILHKKKHGFAVPTSAWFRGKLKDYLFEVLFEEKTRARGYFNYDYIEKIYHMYQSGKQPLDSQLWLLLNFELWHRQFIDASNQHTMTVNNPMVSVIITTYNREKLLGKAIESVLAQTYSHIELIIIDNGSTDNTREVIRFYEADPRVSYIYQGDRGRYIATLNDGIRSAKGKYIAVLDDDDFWCDVRKIEKQVDFLEKHREYVLVGGGLIGIDQRGQEIARYLLPEQDRDIKKTLLISNTLAHTTVLFKKQTWQKTGGYDDGLDWGLWLKMGKEGKFYNLQEFFIVYTGHPPGEPGFVEKKYTRWEFLKINIALKKKYKDYYPGYYRALLLCWFRYFYSLLPFRLPVKRQMWAWWFHVKRWFGK